VCARARAGVDALAQLIKGAIASARPASIAARGDAARVSHVVKGLARSVRLWSLYVDLEEHVGTFESTCSAYGS
jgi:hypothetical protein